MTTVMAFSNASFVRIWRAVMPASTRRTTASPDAMAYASRRLSTAGGAALPGSDMPSASAALAMVLAVYMPPQAPWPGQVAFSIASSSSCVMSPRASAPTPSKTSMMVRSRSTPFRPASLPGSVEPAYRKTLARSSRAAAMSIPGSDLSQPASVTEPSRRSANMTVSTLSAMTSRDTSEARIPSWPMEMPSETEMVPNSIGKPPARRTPSLDACARRCSDRLQGVISFQDEAMPICGLSMSSSVIPTARSIARAGARWAPSVTSVLRGLRGCVDGPVLTRSRVGEQPPRVGP